MGSSENAGKPQRSSDGKDESYIALPSQKGQKTKQEENEIPAEKELRELIVLQKV